MNSDIAPDEMDYCHAKAPIIGASDHFGPANNNGRSDALLVELSRFLQRVSVQGVTSPFDRALLKGVKEILESLLKTCEDLTKKEQPTPSDEELMIASLGVSEQRVLESMGPEDVDKPRRKRTRKTKTRKSTKKKTTRKKRAKTGKSVKKKAARKKQAKKRG